MRRRLSRGGWWWLSAVLASGQALVAARTVHAQRVERPFFAADARWEAERRASRWDGVGVGTRAVAWAGWLDANGSTSDSGRATPHRSTWTVAASAVLPGAGQAMLGQRRSLLYVAFEAIAFSSYNRHTRVARRTRNEYRALASNVARAPYASVRPVGSFDYYERMEHYAASGAFDLGAGGPLQPELDTTTFNGATWLLARRTYWQDPTLAPERGSAEWLRAEQFYLQRAIRPEFRWSWSGAEREYALFKSLIRRSNERYRAAITDLGFALGNHFLSAIDATVSLRLEQRRNALGTTRLVGLEVPLPDLTARGAR